MDKDSKHYLKTTYKLEIYGDGKSTTCEKEFTIYGNDKDNVDSSAGWIKSKVMP